MEIFRYAKVVLLRSRNGKYLLADEDEMSVTLDKNGRSFRTAQFSVELVPLVLPNSQHVIRLKSCFDKYLTASNQTHSLGGFKVLQTVPQTLDDSIEWEPITQGIQFNQVKLKTLSDTFLRACKFRKNSVSHERKANQDGIIWDVEIVEMTISEELHKAAETFYHKHSSPEVRSKAEDFFRLMDTDGNGEVSIVEFRNFFNQFDNINMGMDSNFFAAFDRNGDGSLQFDEVITMYYIMLTRAQAAQIQQFQESLKAQIQYGVQPDAKNESGEKRNKAFLDFFSAMLKAVGSVGLVFGCCIM